MSEDEFHKQHTVPGLLSNKTSLTGQPIPKMVGPYKIESLLEKGGMSILYLATHPDLKELTTIKVLLPRFLSYPEAVQRFLNESEIIAMTDHPNIVKLYGHGKWEGGLYIAMEYIHGISLRQAILQNPISLKRALEIIIDIAYALCHLHTHGVIHRDLKPENILITNSNQVKVIDFGIAQLLTEKTSSGSPPRQKLIGTPIYMSPEQRANPETVSYPSDIYSLGIIAYEVVLGKLSHGQLHLSLMPKGLQKILNKALQPKPEDRYQDIVDFITDVSAYLNSANIHKEKKVGDQLSELSENLRQADQMLSPTKLPEWDNIEIGVAAHKTTNAYGIFHEFFNREDGSFGIVLGESSAKGAEGIICMAMTRGMLRAFRPLGFKPLELATMLNTIIIQDGMEHILALSYLILSPKDNKLNYISCGYGNLWRIPSDSDTPIKLAANNIALGIDDEAEFKEIVAPWEIGDRLILNSFVAGVSQETLEPVLPDASAIKALLHENADFSSQRIVDAMLRKITLSFIINQQERTLTLIGLLRKK